MALTNCPECNKEISDTVKKCPNCGYKVKTQKRNRGVLQGESKNGILKKFKSWQIRVVVAAVVVVIAGGMIAYFCMSSPVRKVENYLAEGNTKEAQMIFDEEIKADGELLAKLESKLSDVLLVVIDDYAKDAHQYDKYGELKKFVSSNYKDYDMTSYDKQVEEIKASKTHYDEARKNQNSKKYDVAILEYEKVIEKDSNYTDAHTQIDKCKAEYKKIVFGELDKQISSSSPSYKDVESMIKEREYLSEDNDILAKLTELKKKVRDYQIINAQELAKKQDYLKAMQVLSEIPKEYLQDSQVSEVTNSISNIMIKWAVAKAKTLAKEKKYNKAVELLAQYQLYDAGNTISKTKSSYQEKEKKIIIDKFKKLKRKLRIKYDSIDENYEVVYKGYDTEYINISSRINIEANAKVDKREKNVDFNLIVGFVQDDWIFTEQVKFAVGKYRETYIIEYSDRYTQVVGNGNIAEWMYLNDLQYSTLSDDMDTLISKITTAKKTKIRFGADGNGARNHIITSLEKNNIKTVYKFCQMLQEYDYLYKYI